MSPLESGTRWLQATGRLPSVVAARIVDGAAAEVVGLGADADTQYRIGSITKTLVAVLVLQLRDAGELGLDDPVGAHLPELAGAPYGEVSLGQLLSHTGGLQSEPVGPWWERSPGVDVATLLAANRGAAAVAAPPSWFHYSNLGYALLGQVAARRHDQPHEHGWWRVVEERLLAPLGMTRTTYAPAAPYAQGSSVGHLTGVVEDEPHHDTGAMAPAGQVWSTVGDLARWGGLLAVGHPDVVAADTVREMGRAQADGYGLGLRRIAMDAAGRAGQTWVGHTGSMPGFLASLFVDQASGEGTVLLTNATTGLVADEVPWVLTRGRDVVAPWVPTSHVPAAVTGLLGTWFWGNTAVELRWQNETLQLRNLATGRHSDTFALDGERLVGIAGYHRGETLHVHPDRLECATFVYTRSPYGR